MINANCRSCELIPDLYKCDNNHSIIKDNLYCLICESMVDSYFHSEQSLQGICFECSKCNNYILYFNDDNSLHKDEIYFNIDYYLIRDFQKNSSEFYNKDTMIYEVNLIIPYFDKDKLFQKLNNLSIYS